MKHEKPKTTRKYENKHMTKTKNEKKEKHKKRMENGKWKMKKCIPKLKNKKVFKKEKSV